MSVIHKLDKTDLRILKNLQENSAISNLELAKRIGLSPTPTFERVKKLERYNVIKSYHAVVDAEELGVGIQTYMLITLSEARGHELDNFAKQVNEIDEIVECHFITGTSDCLLKIMAKDIGAYDKLTNTRIRNIKEIGSMTTMVILSTIKKSRVVPINYSQEEKPIT